LLFSHIILSILLILSKFLKTSRSSVKEILGRPELRIGQGKDFSDSHIAYASDAAILEFRIQLLKHIGETTDFTDYYKK